MKMEAKDLKPYKVRIYGFNCAAIEAVGFVELPVELGEGGRRGGCRFYRLLFWMLIPHIMFF